MKKIDRVEFEKDLHKAVEILPTNDTEASDLFYNTTLQAVLYKHAPVVTKLVTFWQKVPWFNEELLNLKHTMRKNEWWW